MAEMLLPEVWFETSEENKELIGEGSYGKVYKVTDPGGNVSAVKIIPIPDNDSQLNTIKSEMKDPDLVRNFLLDATNEFSAEIRTMEKFKDSKNIVRLKSHYVEAAEDGYRFNVYIQMEFLDSLYSYFGTDKDREENVIRMGIDLCRALMDCHKKNIIHRDIKPDNIMVDPEGNFKLADFGIARHMEKTMGTMSQRGSISYMAPEVYHGARYGKTVDIYSLGLVMYHFLNKDRDPFLDPDQKLIRYKEKESAIKKRMDGIEIPPPKNASRELSEIIGRAVAYKQEERYQDADDMLRDLLDLQKGIYRLGKSWADKDFTHRVKLFVYHHKYKMLAAALALIAVFGGLRLARTHKSQVKVKEWTAPGIELSDDEKQSICDEVLIYDDVIWNFMAEDDSESFTTLFPEYSQNDFENFRQEYYTLSDSRENLTDDYDKYIDAYHNDCEVYTHLISQEEDTYYVEVCRYYIKKEKEDYENIKNLEEYYQGHLLQATAYYRVDMDQDQINNVTLYLQTDNEDSQPVAAHVHLFDELLESLPGVNNLGQFRERESANFLFMENDFVYDGFFRVDPVAYYIDEKDKTITFIISIKNGMDQDVQLKTMNITYQMGDQAEDFPGDDQDYNLNLTSKHGQDTCILFTYPLKKTDEIAMDTYKEPTAVRLDFQNNLEGAE